MQIMRIADPEARKAFVEVVSEALKPLEVETVYLFGTHGTSRQRADSDVDVAFLARKPNRSLEIQGVRQDLAERLNKDVDVLDLMAVPVSMRFSVVTSGDRLLDLNPEKRREFEMYTYSDYLRLKEERAPILAAIRKELQ